MPNLFDETYHPDNDRAFRVRVEEYGDGQVTVSLGRSGKGGDAAQSLRTTKTEAKAICHALLTSLT